ncbi:hypothetical protein D9619_010803 [Psilocybe cf. subviscida]|uniref:N-acetyltransferase domain-containing protein n=1 Tax=Psilocybe cf. subviscida TaxID=2480587 RepID=A0A8H5EZY6_9AGAR|nr:hypothetical protein D9619_010803 [Psilocybe cf. subviscida]
MSELQYPSVRRLINASDDEIEQCTSVLCDAFDGDPFTSILLGGDVSLQPQEIRANVCAALIGPGQVHILEIGNEVSDIVGVAIWYPPGARAFASEEERAAGWDQFLAEIPLSLRSWWLDYFVPTISGLSGKALGPTYLLNSWHLHLFGVLKAHQGKKYGRILFEFAQRQAKTTKSPIVVETTTEVDVSLHHFSRNLQAPWI